MKCIVQRINNLSPSKQNLFTAASLCMEALLRGIIQSPLHFKGSFKAGRPTHFSRHTIHFSASVACLFKINEPKKNQKKPNKKKKNNNNNNKKVLLRDRKRHTARRVASARYAALSRGGTPSQVGGVPHTRVRGYPSQVGGAPSQGGGRVPRSSIPGWGEGYPSHVLMVCVVGSTPSQHGGYPSQVLMWGGTWGIPSIQT